MSSESINGFLQSFVFDLLSGVDLNILAFVPRFPRIDFLAVYQVSIFYSFICEVGHELWSIADGSEYFLPYLWRRRSAG